MIKYPIDKIGIFAFLIILTAFAALFHNTLIKSTVYCADAIIADVNVVDGSVLTVSSIDSEPSTENKDTVVSPEATSVIAILLDPHIRAAIEDYFGEPTQYALYDSIIKEIARVGNNFINKVTISVPTFHGAHNPPYGLETMTFTIKPGGAVELDNYVHQNN